MRTSLQPEITYVDRETDYTFIVLKVNDDTVEVMDEQRNKRLVNRMLCERDFVKKGVKK